MSDDTAGWNEHYDARLLELRPEVLVDALRKYEAYLREELVDEPGLNGTMEMGYFGERLMVVTGWLEELDPKG